MTNEPRENKIKDMISNIEKLQVEILKQKELYLTTGRVDKRKALQILNQLSNQADDLKAIEEELEI